MESGIKYSYLRNFRQQFLYGINTFQVCRIVQRTEVTAFFYCCNNGVVNQYRTAEFCTSVQNAMTYSLDFVQIFYSSVFGISQSVENKLYAGCVFRYVLFEDFLFSIRQSQLQERTRQTDFFDTSLCEDFFGSHFEQFVFDR